MSKRDSHAPRSLRLELLESRICLSGVANPGVIPIQAEAFGTTYNELAGEWWQWGLTEPIESNPILDETGEFCDLNQEGKVWFLAGNFGGETHRECTIPAGKAIFFPLVNSVFWVPEDGATEGEVRDLAAELVDPTSELSATIDGEELDNLFSYRAASPAGGFTLEVLSGSIAEQLGYAPGPRDPAVADGYWLLLAPLSVGHHEIQFSATVGDPENPDFALDISYDLNVVARGRALYSQDAAQMLGHDETMAALPAAHSAGLAQLQVAAATATNEQLDRLQDSIRQLNASLVPSGIELVYAGGMDATSADIFVEHAAYSPCGSAADGVLGCALDDGHVTIVDSWNFYAGSDPLAIGAGQYDYQSVLTHELAHAAGLDHLADPGSALFATLAPGAVHRTLEHESLELLDTTPLRSYGLMPSLLTSSSLLDSLDNSVGDRPTTSQSTPVVSQLRETELLTGTPTAEVAVDAKIESKVESDVELDDDFENLLEEIAQSVGEAVAVVEE